MKQYLLILIMIGFTLAAAAQWYDPEKVSPKAQLIYSGAIQSLQDGEWNNARTLLKSAIKTYPKFVEAWLSLGGMYGQLKQYDSAIYSYAHAYQLDSIFSNDLLLPWSINLAGLGRFAEAAATADKLINNPATDRRTVEATRYRRKTYQFALDFEQAHGKQENFSPRNLGDSINSSRSEYYPSFTIDDSMMVFTRRMQGIREDFIRTVKNDTSYSFATPVEGLLNEEPSKGGISISQDGDWLLFAGFFKQSGYGDFDIYLSYATPAGWSEPYNLGHNINTEFWESSPSISPDKQTLYFSSSRPGGFGGKDLYVSHRLANGTWSPAENMGANFNTAADDLAPFIHADNQTLYFTSGGHPGYGGSDIYVCRKGPNGAWSLPQNIGYPVNTIEDEGSMIVTAGGETAYYSANGADTRGGLDLYSFQLPIFARPKRTLWIKGQVHDIATKKGLPSAIELKDIATGAVIEKVVTDETGNYLVTLPVGSDYTFTVNRKGYLFYSDSYLLASQPSDSTYRKDIPLQPIAINTSLELKNILFPTNAFTLEPFSFTELDKVVQLLNDNPSLRIQINGHTDNVGTPAANLLLSNNRAKAVVAYLTAQGIASARLTSIGFGAAKPIASNATEAGRTRNRRTELVVTGM